VGAEEENVKTLGEMGMG